MIWRKLALAALLLWVASWLGLCIVAVTGPHGPGFGRAALVMVIGVAAAPLLAALLSATALIRPPRVPASWLLFALSTGCVLGQAFLFMVTASL